MKLSKLVQSIRDRLERLYSENAPHSGESSEPGAQYSLKITEVRFERGISCRKSCKALMYSTPVERTEGSLLRIGRK